MLEKKISRRNLLKYAGISAGVFLFPACETITQDEEQSTFPDKREKMPLPGDVVKFNSKYYLLREHSEGKFAYEIPDFEKYKRLTKFDKYKRRSFQTLAVPSNYKLMPFTKENEGGLADIYTGDWKDGKIYGGEINVFFPGFMTDAGVLFPQINPTNETFSDLRESLKKNHWDLADNLFFTYGDTYGKDGSDGYQAKNTAINPEINIKKALEFFDYLKREFPLAQFNLIGHSLGGIFALEVAKQSPDCINNLILMDSPVLGIKRDKVNTDKVETFKRILAPIIGEEKVSDFLLERWDSREEIEKFIRDFIGSGKNVTDIYSSDDRIIPLESKTLQGARQIVVPTGEVDSPLIAYLQAHGRVLKKPGIVKIILDIIGENETR